MTATTVVGRRPADWSTDVHPATWAWSTIPALPPLTLADGNGPALHETQVRLVADSDALYVRFDCTDDDIWATYTRRDDPIYEEEVVEVFLAPGDDVPRRYVEIEVNPDGVLFDAVVDNPPGRPEAIGVDRSWSCPGIAPTAERDDAARHWAVTLALPWQPIASAVGGDVSASVWRANFYRIERPRDGSAEFSCWSPTLTEPANFHHPDRFGTLVIK